MTTRAEDVLLYCLTETDELETLCSIGLPPEAIPTAAIRPIVAWAQRQFFDSSMTRAPSREALVATWGNVLEDAEIELIPVDEEVDTITWAIEQIKGAYVFWRYADFQKSSATAMSAAALPDRTKVLSAQADELFELSMSVQSHDMQVTYDEGLRDSYLRYLRRQDNPDAIRGMTFAMPLIDEHTFGIQPGELAILAAPPKAGKSYFLNFIADSCMNQEKVTVLFTLENSVEMTLDRIACIRCGIDSNRYQRGLLEPHEVERIERFITEEMGELPGTLHVIMPESGARTIASMIRLAQMLGADQVIIDQLTFVEHPDPRNLARHEVVRDIMRDAKILISTASKKIPVIMAHQLNREGIKAAAKQGYIEMWMLAEASEVERTADWVLGVYQTRQEQLTNLATFQIVASRRGALQAWQMAWALALGEIAPLFTKQLGMEPG